MDAAQAIDHINAKSSKWTIAGWLIGLAVFNWFSASAPTLAWWVHALLVVVGMFVASIVIGGGVALIIAALTKGVTGRSDGSIHGYSWGAFLSPVLAFFAAKYVLQAVAS